MAADILASAGWIVDVHERMPSLGRKFLLAGRGGLNLTHSEPLDAFLLRYGDASPEVKAAIEAFPPASVIAWAESLGEATFVGSSGRVFPKAMKTSPLLRAWLKRLDGLGVRFHVRSHWLGWDHSGDLLFDQPKGMSSWRIPMRPFSRSAAAVGHASARTAAGCSCWLPKVSRSRL